jgi:glycosyl hydrolase group 75 (putative chitosanase)
MRCNVIMFAAAMFLYSSAGAKGKQASSALAIPLAGNSTQAGSVHNCNVASDQSPATEQSAGPAIPSVHPDRDLIILQQKQSDLTQCLLSAEAQGSELDSEATCSGLLLLNFQMRHDGERERDIPIGRLPGTSAFFYESGMTIDADGAPNAYHPDNSGLDDVANAGTPGVWEGLAKDRDGQPYIQGPNDPFPGYYVSATALADRSKPVNDPTRYVDASKIPFVVLPGRMARLLGARPGDFAAVFNQRNGKSSYAIFGDVGPSDRIGEGSVALAENLGIQSDARNGGARRGILYIIFPGSGDGRPRTIDEINGDTQKLLQEWESSASPDPCAIQPPAPAAVGNRSTN